MPNLRLRCSCAVLLLAACTAPPAADAAAPAASSAPDAPIAPRAAEPRAVDSRPDGASNGEPQPHDLQWDEQPGSLALLRSGQVVWRFCHGDERPKPCVHPLALDGAVLTLDQPADHRWHHGLWFSWKLIDGVNYWENEAASGRPAGRTSWQLDGIDRRDDGSARIVLQLQYAPATAAAGEAVLRERRVLEFSAPAADGSYAIDWDCAFTAERACLLDRTPLPGEPGGKVYGGYAGLSLRLVQLDQREAVTSEGPAAWNRDDRCRTRASAFEYDGELGGRTLGVAILEHAANPGAPTPWYAIRSKAMSFFTPAVLCHGARRLQQGERLTLRYRVWVHPGRWDQPRLLRELAAYAGPASR